MANDKILVLEGEKSEMLSLVKKTFYSNKGIFLRELIINASNLISFDISNEEKVECST
ncbi:Heat shock protein Hsp90 [Vigna unguiculata]|uniref:Heat shock protein Hsp90 n=1 Tax=Vigna unguiculata TaxID=3917 RepID=A0A4D6LY86_VIGUN|nr:Heat shock protein Hsp90 [Vigna unguiculata]